MNMRLYNQHWNGWTERGIFGPLFTFSRRGCIRESGYICGQCAWNIHSCSKNAPGKGEAIFEQLDSSVLFQACFTIMATLKGWVPSPIDYLSDMFFSKSTICCLIFQLLWCILCPCLFAPLFLTRWMLEKSRNLPPLLLLISLILQRIHMNARFVQYRMFLPLPPRKVASNCEFSC